jgi:hypothetical protein
MFTTEQARDTDGKNDRTKSFVFLQSDGQRLRREGYRVVYQKP